MAVQGNNNSRFTKADPIYINGKETYGMWSRPDFMKVDNVPQDQIQQYQIDQRTAGRPDLIALDIYNDQNLDWVVIMFNSPMNTLGWPKAGTVIKLPSKSTVLSGL
jgi:hypothetical protein